MGFHDARRALVWMGCAAAAWGCSDDNGGHRPPYRAGVAPEAQVSTLDDTQLRDACERYDVYVDTYVNLDAVAYVACLPLALVASTTPAQCQQQLDTCMAAFPAPIRVQGTAQVDACVAELRGCNASVAQFEDCVNGNVGLAVDYGCGGVGDSAYVEHAMGIVSVCADIDQVCDQFETVNPQ